MKMHPKHFVRRYPDTLVGSVFLIRIQARRIANAMGRRRYIKFIEGVCISLELMLTKVGL